ncbi:hypothetical protein [Kitasatospora sp. NPDC091207]|uniref:hypothetical protein n=1 Tax=Kitasatospora sp. NPDC091207 TaxID=3364083 RepID=UPI00381BE8D4
MNEFDRDQAQRKSKNLSHLKDDVDEKNTEHIERIRQHEDEIRQHDPAHGAAEQPQRSQSD